jgi:membrane protein required for colicin V production
MFIDIITIILLVMAVFKGLRKGFVVAVFSFVAYLIGLAAALKLSTLMAGYIGSNVEISQRWLPALAFFLVFVIVVLLVRLGAKAIESAMRLLLLGWLNRLGGLLFYVLIYFFIFSILLFYATQLHLIKEDTIKASATYDFIAPFGPKMIDILGVILPFFRDMFDELLDFFGKTGGKKVAT